MALLSLILRPWATAEDLNRIEVLGAPTGWGPPRVPTFWKGLEFYSKLHGKLHPELYHFWKARSVSLQHWDGCLLLSEGCYLVMEVPLNPVKGSPLLGLCDTRLGRCVQWQHHPPTLSLVKGSGAPICPSRVPLRFYDTALWWCCCDLRSFFPSFFFPFLSFSTLTVPNLQSALITKFLRIRRLTDYANYIRHLWPSISAGATFCIWYPLM